MGKVISVANQKGGVAKSTSLAAVSYTHLDVYKRQVHSGEVSVRGLYSYV